MIWLGDIQPLEVGASQDAACWRPESLRTNNFDYSMQSLAVARDLDQPISDT
jgi:hypothetical protein